MKKRKLNPRRITDNMVREGVKARISKLENELRRNPNNTLTAQRLGELKKLHKGKL